MRTRIIIVPVLAALTAAGVALPVAALPAAAAAPTAHVQADGTGTGLYYHG